jgi:hypothetical protein
MIGNRFVIAAILSFTTNIFRADATGNLYDMARERMRAGFVSPSKT